MGLISSTLIRLQTDKNLLRNTKYIQTEQRQQEDVYSGIKHEVDIHRIYGSNIYIKELNVVLLWCDCISRTSYYKLIFLLSFLYFCLLDCAFYLNVCILLSFVTKIQICINFFIKLFIQFFLLLDFVLCIVIEIWLPF